MVEMLHASRISCRRRLIVLRTRSAPRPPLLGLVCWSALQSKLTDMLFRIGRLSMMAMTLSVATVGLARRRPSPCVDRLHGRPGSLAVLAGARAGVTARSRCPGARRRLPFDRTSRPRLDDRSPARPDVGSRRGRRRPRSSSRPPTANTASGTVVHLDPDLDLALVETDRRARAGRWPSVEPIRATSERSSCAATTGCSRCRSESCDPSRSAPRTSTSRATVLRPGYELDATIEPGDSGGVVVVDGRAVAVVWSRSRQDESRGMGDRPQRDRRRDRRYRSVGAGRHALRLSLPDATA